MKKVMILVCVLALARSALCGCGSIRDNEPMQTPAATMGMIPEISPVITPDMNDGVVKDQDGLIEDNEAVGTAVPKASPKPSASPAVTAKP